ncbi:TRAP transporter small permease [Ramlibacter algicola]|uniref:TRAP transporter small permease protein n=1 Tax=Ramlibacter algicola TaxID=2795217 RepID=A0A934UR44_9BURK|nr:TRAP transporter small permease [Ramlibacter algicola]MBK0392800.1 TRAP transporter small permease [Ramlibacter algicola]
MDKLLRGYCRLLEVLIAACLATMVLLVFGNVVLRYAFNSGITVSEEISRWLFVWLTFLGGVVALHEHAHLGTEILVSKLGVAGKKACLVGAYALMLLMCWMLFSGALAQTKINWDVSAPSSGASMAWFYAVGLVFGVSAGAVLLNDLFKVLTGRVSEDQLIMVKESEDQK